MSAAPDLRQRALSTEDAIDAVWAAIADGTYTGVAEAARALWPSLVLDRDSLDMLAVEGLISLSMSEKRHAVDAGKPVPWGAPHGKRFEKYIALTWPFEAADGRQLPLLKFTRTDLSALALRAGKLEQTYRGQKEFAVSTDRLLIEHGAAEIGRLPGQVLKDVSDAALAAFGGKS